MVKKTKEIDDNIDIDAVLSRPARAKSWDSAKVIALLDKSKGFVSLEEVRPMYHGDKYTGYSNADRCLLWGALNIINRHFKKAGKGLARAVYPKLVIVYSKTFEK